MEGFESIAALVNEFTQRAEMHACTSVNVGPGQSVPAIPLPQVQLDLQLAISRAFHAGATLQAAINPWPSRIMIDDPASGEATS
jgi:hypothetical protein